jgi:hypothetical protein
MRKQGVFARFSLYIVSRVPYDDDDLRAQEA